MVEKVIPKTSSKNPFWGGPHIMGIVNVTPDSFSDGGQFFDPEAAIAHGIALVHDGAHTLDVGGESTRPGAETVKAKDEIDRIMPVINGLRQNDACRNIKISIDTRNSETMVEALKAGASIVNDISALTHDSQSINVVAEANVPVVLMHAQGAPQSMQKNPKYNNVVHDVFKFLESRINFCKTHRIDPQMIICDPGIGFGKTLEHNLLLHRNIRKFHDLGVPLMLGASRKSFIAKVSHDEPPADRIPGSLSAALYGYQQGVQIFRVHDVKETLQAFKIYDAILSAGEEVGEILSA